MSNAPQQVRIIGGQWRSRRLAVVSGEGLRPTPNRVRETLFNWLGQNLEGWRCLDAFAGTGALGLEAASRGAASVVLCETDARARAQLRSVVQQWQAVQVEVYAGSGLKRLEAAQAAYELVLLDPPFASEWGQAALGFAQRAVVAEGWVYWEAAHEWTAADLLALGFERYRYLRAGAVHAHLLRRIARPS